MITIELDRNQHSVYLLNYHLVMVVKYRRKVINDEISEYLKHRFVVVGQSYGINLQEWNYDIDHVHVLFRATPHTEMAKFLLINHQVLEWLRNYFQKLSVSCGNPLFGPKAIV